MDKKFHYITVRLAPNDETKFNEAIKESSIFFKAAFSLDASIIVGPLADEAKKDASLGHIWENIKPEGDKYFFEIATELPYYLPDLDGKTEYIIKLRDSELIVCNRMVRAFCGEGLPHDANLKYILVHRKGLPSVTGQTAGIHPLPLKTVIIRKYVCISSSAEEAIERHFIPWREDLLSQISHLVDVFRMIDPIRVRHLLPYAALSAFPVFWVAVLGANNQIGCQQFTGDVGAIAHRTVHNVTGEQYGRFMEFLTNDNPIPQYEMGISLAITFLHYRYYELALIQVCTACETFLSKVLRDHLLIRGLSNKHLKNFFEDISFSHLLNLHLPNIRDLTKFEDYQQVIGHLNWARQRRNEIVHEGRSSEVLKANDVQHAIDAAGKLINFVLQTH
jgi:hypothetical protein